ncbi:ABC transporter permease [Bradyrhizobium sp.]|uniref:ABC transporter permease n=1 Tax=Bradyrhizobium sp. TaxID=376 RepID=UPI003D142014
MARLIGLRILQAVPTVLLVITACFFLLRLAPGDVAQIMAGEAGAAPPGYVEELRARFGLDKPLLMQFGHYLARLAMLDLGYSFRHARPVLDLVLERLGPTLLLGASSLFIAIVLGVALGVLAAVRHNRLADRLISAVSLIAYAAPTFWLGLMLIVVFGVKLGWLPTGGVALPAPDAGLLERLSGLLSHLLLPAITLSTFYLALYVRLSRTAVLDVLHQDYIRTATSKGLSSRRKLLRHVLPNALTPVLSVAGVHVGGLIGGAVFVETVFGWPGLGRLAFEAMLQRDFNLLMAVLIFSSLLVILTNILVDIVYQIVDPRMAKV